MGRGRVTCESCISIDVRRWNREGRLHAEMMLYEAAQSMLMRSAKWSWLKAWAMKIARHRGMKKAIVALARRLAVIMHRLWVDDEECRERQRNKSELGMDDRMRDCRLLRL